MNECLRNHPIAHGGEMVSTIMCAHFNGESAAVYPAKDSPSGFNAISWRDGQPGSVNSPIPEPLAERFAEWCGTWLAPREVE